MRGACEERQQRHCGIITAWEGRDHGMGGFIAAWEGRQRRGRGVKAAWEVRQHGVGEVSTAREGCHRCVRGAWERRHRGEEVASAQGQRRGIEGPLRVVRGQHSRVKGCCCGVRGASQRTRSGISFFCPCRRFEVLVSHAKTQLQVAKHLK